MNERKRFSVGKRISSFRHAIEGIIGFFRTEHNAIIHLLATVTVFVLCLELPVTKMEIIVLVLSMAAVWAAELVNTAIEKMMDLLVPEKKPQVKLIKDLAAAAVLITAAGALVAGCIVFVPKVFHV